MYERNDVSMGAVISVSSLSKEVLKNASAPIILCSFSNRIARLICGSQFTSLNINIRLAEKLLNYPIEQRPQMANDEAMSIVSECNSPTLFENYEILFDPRYDVNTIKVFTELARRQKVIVKWCGTLNGNSLEFATVNDKDYHSYMVQDFDIICVR